MGQEDPRSLTVTISRSTGERGVVKSGDSKEKDEKPRLIVKCELRKVKRRRAKAYRRQFGWGDSLLKSNKGLQRYAKKCNSKSILDCTRKINQAGTQVGYSDQLEEKMEELAIRRKVTLGITG